MAAQSRYLNIPNCKPIAVNAARTKWPNTPAWGSDFAPSFWARVESGLFAVIAEEVGKCGGRNQLI